LSQSRGEILSYELWDGGRLCIPICSPEVPGWEMAPPRRLMNRCSHSIQREEYMDHKEEIQPTGKLEERSSSIPGEEIVEEEIIDYYPHLTKSARMELQESLDQQEITKDRKSEHGRISCDQEETDKSKAECLSLEEVGPRRNGDTSLIQIDSPKIARLYKSYHVNCTTKFTYVDSSHAAGNSSINNFMDQNIQGKEVLKELPGFNVGNLGFMKLLDWPGTKSYLRNSEIWTKEGEMEEIMFYKRLKMVDFVSSKLQEKNESRKCRGRIKHKI